MDPEDNHVALLTFEAGLMNSLRSVRGPHYWSEGQVFPRVHKPVARFSDRRTEFAPVPEQLIHDSPVTVCHRIGDVLMAGAPIVNATTPPRTKGGKITTTRRPHQAERSSHCIETREVSARLHAGTGGWKPLGKALPLHPARSRSRKRDTDGMARRRMGALAGSKSLTPSSRRETIARSA